MPAKPSDDPIYNDLIGQVEAISRRMSRMPSGRKGRADVLRLRTEARRLEDLAAARYAIVRRSIEAAAEPWDDDDFGEASEWPETEA